MPLLEVPPGRNRLATPPGAAHAVQEERTMLAPRAPFRVTGRREPSPCEPKLGPPRSAPQRHAGGAGQGWVAGRHLAGELRPKGVDGAKQPGQSDVAGRQPSSVRARLLSRRMSGISTGPAMRIGGAVPTKRQIRDTISRTVSWTWSEKFEDSPESARASSPPCSRRRRSSRFNSAASSK